MVAERLQLGAPFSTRCECPQLSASIVSSVRAFAARCECIQPVFMVSLCHVRANLGLYSLIGRILRNGTSSVRTLASRSTSVACDSITTIKDPVKLIPWFIAEDWAILQTEVKRLYWPRDKPKNTMAALGKLVKEACISMFTWLDTLQFQMPSSLRMHFHF